MVCHRLYYDIHILMRTLVSSSVQIYLLLLYICVVEIDGVLNLLRFAVFTVHYSACIVLLQYV